MESLAGTRWDVVIEGTGLQQSLLALALSRSETKVLHVDGNSYYGGPEAAFSLQEAEAWAASLAENHSRPFSNVSWRKVETTSSTKNLSPSRAYTLTLSPQVIYSKSKLVSQLVSSQVYRQLEFQAVGNWWLYGHASDGSPGMSEAGTLRRMPNGREDVFSDKSIDVKAKRGLMKFLKFAIDFENQPDIWESHAQTSLPQFLASQFQLPLSMQTFLLALTLSLDLPENTSVRYALPRIARHLTSIGVFGPGFGAVIPKWGGGAEIAQVACRAGAVGGAVYVLGTGISGSVNTDSTDINLKLTNDEVVQTGYYISSQDKTEEENHSETTLSSVSKIVAIVSADLSSLFVTSIEGAPVAAVSVVAFPTNTVVVNDQSSPYPVFVMVHSSDSGECPQGQYILYASTTNSQNPKARLHAAVSELLTSIDGLRENSEQHTVLFEIYYEQSRSSNSNLGSDTSCALPSPSLDLAFDDSTLEDVEDAWRRIIRNPDTEVPYMVFETREQLGDSDDDNSMGGSQ